jgi:hypothetical protein
MKLLYNPIGSFIVNIVPVSIFELKVTQPFKYCSTNSLTLYVPIPLPDFDFVLKER